MQNNSNSSFKSKTFGVIVTPNGTPNFVLQFSCSSAVLIQAVLLFYSYIHIKNNRLRRAPISIDVILYNHEVSKGTINKSLSEINVEVVL